MFRLLGDEPPKSLNAVRAIADPKNALARSFLGTRIVEEVLMLAPEGRKRDGIHVALDDLFVGQTHTGARICPSLSVRVLEEVQVVSATVGEGECKADRVEPASRPACPLNIVRGLWHVAKQHGLQLTDVHTEFEGS